MAIREILVVPDPRLKQVSQPVEGPVTDAHRALMDDMLETMYAAPGIGLAAIQIGEPVRIIVMDLAREGEEPQPRFFVNPEITWSSEELFSYEEGCLSIPDIYDAVERPARVKLKYHDYTAIRSRKMRRASTPSASSTRWITFRAFSSSITCRA